MTKQEFQTLANAQRLLNKGKWVYLCEDVNGCTVSIKSYNTWVQVMQVTCTEPSVNIRDSGHMDCSVKQYKEFINGMLQSVPNLESI